MVDPVTNPSCQSQRWRSFADRVAVKALIVMSLLMAIAWGLGPVFWLGDLVSHFWPFGGVLLIPATLWCCCRHKQVSWFAWLVFAIWSYPLLGYYWPQPQSNSGRHLRIVSANLYSGNAQAHQALRNLLNYEPDVLVLLEVSPEWMLSIGEVRQTFPYGKVLARDDNFGIALLSKIPLQDITQKNLGSAGVPSLIAEIADPSLTIVATHPLPPMGMAYSDRRNRQLEDIAEHCGKLSGHVVVAGDLNITPWSVHFGHLLRKGNLRDSSLGMGIQPTWPAWTGWPWLPIDHLLVSQHITVQDRTVGEASGSDHHPVIVDLLIPPEEIMVPQSNAH